LTHAQFTDRRFTRLKWLQHLIDGGLVNEVLRWDGPARRVA
jgi:hypothetical protein